jgi:NAD(P)-dependent dehydrogenase (short-subunit alcohol dehydrogenase family)
MKTAVITGASAGLGREIYNYLPDNWDLHDWSLESGIDLRSYNSVMEAAAKLDKLDILVNCAAVNHIDYLEELPEDAWDNVMDTNAKGIFHTAKACLPLLKESKGTILNICSNASHRPMTSSLAYNASKGACHIMTLQLSRELGKRHGITVFGISPNKLNGTEMSKYIDNRVPEQRNWTFEEAKQYQADSLPAGEETDPKACGEFAAWLLSEPHRHKYLQSCILPYGV